MKLVTYNELLTYPSGTIFIQPDNFEIIFIKYSNTESNVDFYVSNLIDHNYKSNDLFYDELVKAENNPISIETSKESIQWRWFYII